MDNNQPQPIDNDMLEPLEEEKQLLMINPLTFLLVITQQQSKCQYDKTSNNHIIQCFEIFYFEH